MPFLSPSAGPVTSYDACTPIPLHLTYAKVIIAMFLLIWIKILARHPLQTLQHFFVQYVQVMHILHRARTIFCGPAILHMFCTIILSFCIDHGSTMVTKLSMFMFLIPIIMLQQWDLLHTVTYVGGTGELLCYDEGAASSNLRVRAD